MEALKRAIEICGGVTALANRISVSQPVVSMWLKRGQIPPERVLAIESATGVSRHDLRPDIYPREPEVAA